MIAVSLFNLSLTRKSVTVATDFWCPRYSCQATTRPYVVRNSESDNLVMSGTKTASNSSVLGLRSLRSYFSKGSSCALRFSPSGGLDEIFFCFFWNAIFFPPSPRVRHTFLHQRLVVTFFAPIAP